MVIATRKSRVDAAILSFVALAALGVSIVWPPAFWLCGLGAGILTVACAVASFGRQQPVLFVFWVPTTKPLLRWEMMLAMLGVVLLVIPLTVMLVKGALL